MSITIDLAQDLNTKLKVLPLSTQLPKGKGVAILLPIQSETEMQECSSAFEFDDDEADIDAVHLQANEDISRGEHQDFEEYVREQDVLWRVKGYVVA